MTRACVQALPMAHTATTALSGVRPQSVPFSSRGSQAQDMEKAMMLYKTEVRWLGGVSGRRNLEERARGVRLAAQTPPDRPFC